jgi:sn-glycerol 3-phosphate transport system ATP-binding protein
MSYIQLQNIHKNFNEKVIIPNLSFSIKRGSFTVLLGPSGCGKSTTLRMIAGLEIQDKGKIIINNKDISKDSPSKRGLSMVFQSYALFPHLNVKENILFGLKVRKVDKKEQSIRLKKVIKLVDLEKVLESKPSQLSGGQKQRVALARAFVAENEICLMDEPLSNLDAKLRHEMRIEIKNLQRKLHMTVIYVTHDQTEAMSMADHIILLNNGKIEQQGEAKELYENVATTFVGKFIGTPPMNILPIHKEENRLFIQEQEYFTSNPNRITTNDSFIGIRGEDIYFSQEKKGVQGKIIFKDYHGSDTILGISLNNSEELLMRTNKENSHNVGDRIWVNWDEFKINCFNSAGERRVI